MAKDVLARYQCNTLDEVKAAEGFPSPFSTLPFTAIVIGSGMYGAFCAERIYRRGGRMLVLDARPFVVSEHVQNMADPAFLVSSVLFSILMTRKAPHQLRRAQLQRWWQVGRWGGWSPRLTDEDLEQYPPDMKDYFNDFYIGAFPTADFIKGPLKNQGVNQPILDD